MTYGMVNLFFLLLGSAIFAARTDAACDKSACGNVVDFFTNLTIFFGEPGAREDQIETLCRQSEILKSCFDHVDKCVPKTVKDVHDFIRGSMVIIDYCHAHSVKELQITALRMQACDISLRARLPGFKQCEDSFSDEFSRWSGSWAVGGTLLQTGTNLQNLCCAFKRYDACIDPKIVKKSCNAETAAPTRNLLDGVYAAFDCDKRCPSP